MAEITLHSGSFCDRNNNEIEIIFFKKESTPVMTVEPAALSFTSNGGTKTLRVSNYTGTLSISVTGGSGWLTRTQSTVSGVRTYTFTATANTATSVRSATITLTDSYSTVTVAVNQAGVASIVEVNPNYLVFNKNGETKTTTVTWTGGSTPTWSNAPEWASITSSVSGNSMTLTINVGLNTSQYQRTGMVYITNGISRADLSLEQEAVHTVSVQPSSFTFPASGGTQVLTISDIQGSFSMNYNGDGLSVVLLDYPSSTSRRYNVTYTPNTVTATRTGVINVSDTAGGWVAVTTTQAANTDTFAVSPTSFQYGGTGSTNTFTFTGVPAAGISYEIPSGVDWVTVSNFSNSSVDITTAANNNPTSRTTTVKFYDQDDIDNYVTVTVNQEAGQASLSVVPTAITYLPEGGTSGITATWSAGTEPTATVTYVQGTGGWMTPTGNGTVTGNTKEWAWTASANYTGSSRTALITVTNGLQSEYVTVSQSSTTPPATSLSVSPSSLSFIAEGEIKQATVSNISGTVIASNTPAWISVSLSGTGTTKQAYVTAASNSLSTSRSGSVTFDDDRQSPVSMAVEQEGVHTASFTLNPSSIEMAGKSGFGYVSIHPSPSGTSFSITPVTSGEWITSISVQNEVNIYTTKNSSGSQRSAIMKVYKTADESDYNLLTVAQRNCSLKVTTPTISGSEIIFPDISSIVRPSNSGSWYLYLDYDGNLSISVNQSWMSVIVSNSYTQFRGYESHGISFASNSGVVRSGVITYTDDHNSIAVRVIQEGTAPVSSISVSPSSIDFPYTNDAETLTVSGVPSGGFSTSISYNTGASGWLGTTNTAYNIIVTASGTTYPSSRSATLKVTNASDSTDYVDIPITQAGNPQVLSVSPNAWNYPSTLGTHTFTVTYNASGSITTSVAYDREEGEEEIDWLQVELVSHSSGSETWVYSIDVESNNTGSGRAAMVTFEGDGGGTDEVSIYQQP